MSSTFSIPGTIKTQYSPFVLTPGSTAPQMFSFRDKLNICPSSVRDNFNLDIANKLTYAPGDGTSSVSFNTILQQLPGIQIREFLPDTKLDQTINFFGEIIDTVKDMWSDKDKKKEGQKVDSKTDGLFSKIKNLLSYAFDFFTGAKQVNITSALPDGQKVKWYPKSAASNVNKFILDFPYIMYYCLQSSTTTNIYELPCVLADNRVIASDGTLGWGDGADFRVGGLLTKIPVIGSVVNNILGNIGINYLPWWDAASGSRTMEPEIEVSFDLFNDTADAAMMNFIFINTIVPNNKWLQYNMFQHSSNLYDIKIEGLNRLFACSAKFDVSSMGVLRSPPESWLKKLCSKYGNYGGMTMTSSEIKIPDIYRVKMTFKSLLPANFNNFLFAYAANMNITKPNGKSAYADGSFKAVNDSIQTAFVKDMRDFINKGMPSTWT